MAGDGALRAQVEEEVRLAGLSDRFTFTGWVEPQAVLDYYQTGDILLMPSLSEGLPVVGVQALAMGLALVVSRVGGFVELVHEGENGFLFEPQDTQTAQAGLRSLLSDPQCLLTTRAASRSIAAQFDLNHILEAYEQMFIKAVGERKR